MAQFGLMFMQTLTSIAVSALTTQLSDAFGVPLTEVDLAVSISAAAYFPAFIVSTLLYNRLECRTVLIIASLTMIIGGWTRSLAAISNNFWWIVIGQGIIACSGPMVTCAISIIANNWFGDGERALATAIMSLSNPLGSFLSFVIQGIFSAVVTSNTKGQTLD